jgi:hypothetical protein
VLKVGEIDHQIYARILGRYLPILVMELNRSNPLSVPASVLYGAPVAPGAFDLVGRESFAVFQAPQSGMNILYPEQDPAGRRALRGRQPSSATEPQEPGSADNLHQTLLGNQGFCHKGRSDPTPHPAPVSSPAGAQILAVWISPRLLSHAVQATLTERRLRSSASACVGLGPMGPRFCHWRHDICVICETFSRIGKIAETTKLDGAALGV